MRMRLNLIYRFGNTAHLPTCQEKAMQILDDSFVTRKELIQFSTTIVNSIKNSIDERFDEFGLEIGRRFDSMDRRFDGIDQRLDAMDRRFDGIDQRLDAMDRRFDTIESILLNLSEQLRILIDKT